MHKIPLDLKKALVANQKVFARWKSLTPLARNEWVCWVTIVKKPGTRKEHIKQTCEDLLRGKRRPCCWPGCPHRRVNAQKWFRGKT